MSVLVDAGMVLTLGTRIRVDTQIYLYIHLELFLWL
jgi:hypothetical protein